MVFHLCHAVATWPSAAALSDPTTVMAPRAMMRTTEWLGFYLPLYVPRPMRSGHFLAMFKVFIMRLLLQLSLLHPQLASYPASHREVSCGLEAKLTTYHTSPIFIRFSTPLVNTNHQSSISIHS